MHNRIAAMALLLSTPAAALAATSEENELVIRGATVFDGERSLGQRDVLVTQGRVAAIGRKLRVKPRTPVIDGRGKTLLPGLIDSHVHIFPSAAEDALRYGVTTAVDLFNVLQPG